jgi:hypothetical protein
MENNIFTEKRFQYNLLKLSGNTSGVYIETIFEFISYASQNKIIDVYFVEEQYLNVFYNNDEFLNVTKEENICNLEKIISIYKKAKDEDNIEILRLFRKMHREGINFLENPEIKENLKKILNERKSKDEYKSYILMLNGIQQYMQDFNNVRPTITYALQLLLDKIMLDIKPINEY